MKKWLVAILTLLMAVILIGEAIAEPVDLKLVPEEAEMEIDLEEDDLDIVAEENDATVLECDDLYVQVDELLDGNNDIELVNEGPAMSSGDSASIESNGGGTSGETTGSGKCGDNLTWVLDENGVLTISGTGRMWDFRDEPCYNSHESPWVKLMPYIRTVVFNDGITYIGAGAFEDDSCFALTKVFFSDTITEIGNFAFSYCKRLEEVDLPSHLEVIGQQVFSYTAIRSITIPGTVHFVDSFDHCLNLQYVKFRVWNVQWPI